MMESTEIHISAKHVASLCWDGDSLVDWVAGGHRYYLDGTIKRRNVTYGYIFDGVVVSPSREYAAIYVKHGTKGLILKKGEVLREINRSYYCADDYEYPITLFQLRNGQDVIAHCPEEYNRLEIEDLETGKRLTVADRAPSDYFFSRLSTDKNGTRLLSAGWHWHPIDHIKIFDIEEGLKTPSHFDGEGIDLDIWGENSSACFFEGDELIASIWDNHFGDEIAGKNNALVTKDDKARHPSGEIRFFSFSDNKLISSVRPNTITGTIMPVDSTHIVGFFEYPKLINIKSGVVEKIWPHIKSGNQEGSITLGRVFVPPVAIDVDQKRFAVASDSDIAIIQFSE